jgi:hypothetical protein
MKYGKSDGGSAFPNLRSDSMGYLQTEQYGMTLRDYFAAQVLPTITDRYTNLNQNHDYIARLCYDLADAMVAARGN